jgi:hypothetical protein
MERRYMNDVKMKGVKGNTSIGKTSQETEEKAWKLHITGAVEDGGKSGEHLESRQYCSGENGLLNVAPQTREG